MVKDLTPVYEYIEAMLNYVLDGRGIIVTDDDLVRETLVERMGEFKSLKHIMDNLEYIE